MHQILAKTQSGKTMTLELDSKDTIDSIILDLHNTQPIDNAQFMVRDDEHHYHHHHVFPPQVGEDIHKEWKHRMVLRFRAENTIQVKATNGKEYEIPVEPPDTMGQLVRRINEQQGITLNNARVYYYGRVLPNEDTAGSHGIQGGSVINLIHLVSGGE